MLLKHTDKLEGGNVEGRFGEVEGMRLGDSWASDAAVNVMRRWNFLRQEEQSDRGGEVEMTNRVAIVDQKDGSRGSELLSAQWPAMEGDRQTHTPPGWFEFGNGKTGATANGRKLGL